MRLPAIENKKITYMYPKLGPGRVAMAIMYTPYSPDDQVVEMSVAFCSPKDKFKRKMGRMLATDRLLNGRQSEVISFSVKSTEKLKEKALALLNELVLFDDFGPAWAKLKGASKCHCPNKEEGLHKNVCVAFS